MHLGHPIPQTVHDQLKRARMPDIESVSTARIIHIVPRVILDKPVIGNIINASKTQRRDQDDCLRLYGCTPHQESLLFRHYAEF